MRIKKDFNFALVRGPKLKKEVSVGRVRFQTKTIGLVIGVILPLVVVASLPWLWYYKLGLDNVKLNQKIIGLQDIDKQLQKLNGLKQQLQNQKKLQEMSQKTTRDPKPVLDKLQQLLPFGTTVKSFSLQADNTLKFNVSVPTTVDVLRLYTSLRDSGMFEKVDDMQTVSLQDKVQDLSFALKLK